MFYQTTLGTRNISFEKIQRQTLNKNKTNLKLKKQK